MALLSPCDAESDDTNEIDSDDGAKMRAREVSAQGKRKVNVTDAQRKLVADVPTSKKRKQTIQTNDLIDSQLLDASQDRSLLALEVVELLKEVRVSWGAALGPDKLLDKVRHHLEKLPKKQVPEKLASGFWKDVGFTPTKAFVAAPPSALQLIGSYPLHVLTHPAPTIDMALLMPNKCFDDKDQLNHRYYAKRAAYLAAVAVHAKKLPEVQSVDWQVLNNDPRRPLLCLTLRSEPEAAVYVLRIIPAIRPDTFPLRRLAPDKNNVRGVAQEASNGGDPPPTPHYNNAIIQDMMMALHTPLISSALEDMPNAQQAVILLKVFLRQHGLMEDGGGFNGFMVALLVYHLITLGSLEASMPPLDVFKCCLRTLADSNTFKAGLFMKRHEAFTQLPSPPERSTLLRHFCDVVWMDPSGWCNIAAHMTRSTLEKLHQCCSRALIALEGAGEADETAFDDLFVTRHSPSSFADYLYHVNLPLTQQEAPSALQHDEHVWRVQERKVESLLTCALADRVMWVAVQHRQVQGKSPKAGVAVPCGDTVGVYVQVNASTCTRMIDVGPAADDKPAATAFRSLWGDKAELRRFLDGKICEAVVWETPPSQRHLILDSMVHYVLQRHLPSASTVTSFAGGLDPVLQDTRMPLGAESAAGRSLDAALERLTKQLRSLTDLALKVVGVQPASARLRKTAVFPPVPNVLAGAGSPFDDLKRVARCLEPCIVVCQVEGSGSWPNDNTAFCKTKAALGCQLATSLGSTHGTHATGSEVGVDVLLDGFAFRLLLAGDRDGPMAQKALAEGRTLLPSQDLPLNTWLHGMMSGVCGLHPAFPVTCALAKRWVASHLLANHVPEEAVELLVAYVFTSNRTTPCPRSRTAGLMAFLELLSNHPWQQRPLLVDPQHEMKEAIKQQALQAFRTTKNEEKLPGMFLCTAREPTGCSWTRSEPEPSIVHRLAALARKSHALMHQSFTVRLPEDGLAKGPVHASHGRPCDWTTMFKSPLDSFDVLLWLRPEATPTAHRALNHRSTASRTTSAPFTAVSSLCRVPAPAKSARAVLKAVPERLIRSKGVDRIREELLIGFDPVQQYVALLSQRFSHLATFFWDTSAANVVALKWNAAAFVPASFTAASAHTALPLRFQEGVKESDGGVSVLPDVVGVLSDMVGMGEGLVERFELCNKMWRM